MPDYNPLDDVLAAQVKGAVTESFDPVGHARDGRRSTSERTSAGQVSSGKANPRRNTGKGRSGNLTPEELRERKKRIERKKQIAKKKKIRKRIILFSGVILALIVGVIVYLNSYTGKVNKGYRMLENGKYKEALLCFEKAVSKNEKRGEAYEGLAKVYLAQNDTESGEKVFLNAIKEQPSNTEIYQKAIQFYIDTDQKMKVSVLLDQCTSEQVLSACSDYISEEPEYSLDEMKEYEEIQALELTGTGTAIYYTTDGTDPTQNSLKYTEPIRLDEGVTEIRAISVNEKGIPLWSFRDSGLRHLCQWLDGKNDENHFIAAIWNFMMAMWTIEVHPERCNDEIYTDTWRRVQIHKDVQAAVRPDICRPTLCLARTAHHSTLDS